MKNRFIYLNSGQMVKNFHFKHESEGEMKGLIIHICNLSWWVKWPNLA